jgi:Flp pilus assembly protein TadD
MTNVFAMVRVSPFLLCTAIALFPAAVAAQPAGGTRVLVMPFAAEAEPGAPGSAGAALWLGEAASTLLTEGLATEGVGVLSRPQRLAAFDRLNLPMTSALTRATMIRVGELMGASAILFGEVRLGAALEIRARLVQLSTGQEMPAVQARGALADIFPEFGQVARRIADHIGRSAPASAAPAPLALETFENYLKGLVATTPAVQQRFLEAAVQQAPTDPRILMALWDVYTAQGAHDRALAAANAVPPDAAAYRHARFAVALSMIELRRFDGAWQTLTGIYETGRAAAISSALGVVQLRRGTASGGGTPTAYFKRAVDEDPENTDYLFNLGYAHARAQNSAEALTWLREVVRFDAADGGAHQVMSAVLAAAGRTTEAQRELELARLLGGTEQEAAGLVLTSQLPADLERLPGGVDLSAGSRLRTIVVDPTQRDQRATAQFHLANGRSLVEARKDREALDELRRAIYLSPYEEEPHRLVGQIYQRAGRLSEAIEQFTVALWCRETAAGRVALGAALLETGQVEAARREANRALVLAPESPEARALGERLAN